MSKLTMEELRKARLTALSVDEKLEKAAIPLRWYEDIPQRQRGLYLMAKTTHSPVNAIEAFCLECVCWQPKEVALCTAPRCPLFQYRPFQDMDVEK